MKLIIPKAIEKKIHDYVMAVDSEIAGMGSIELSESGDITLTDVMIYEQDVTGGTADLSSEAIAKWQSELVKAGGSPKKWKLWWHSHVNMPAFFSGIDTATMDRQTEGDFMVSLVVNKRRERLCRMDVYRPFRMKQENVSIEIQGVEAYAIPAEIIAEVAEKVKSKIYKPTIGFVQDAADKVWGKKNSPNDAIYEAIALHRRCPMASTNGADHTCYFPYGVNKNAVYTDCTTKKFKKLYGKHPFKNETAVPAGRLLIENKDGVLEDTTEVEYSIQETLEICKVLEGQIKEMDDKGLGDTPEALTLCSELSDWYYALADLYDDETIAENIRTEARLLEDDVAYAGGYKKLDMSEL